MVVVWVWMVIDLSGNGGVRQGESAGDARGAGRKSCGYFFLFEAAFDLVACFCVAFGDLSPMAGIVLWSALTFGMFVSPRALFFINEGPASGKLRRIVTCAAPVRRNR